MARLNRHRAPVSPRPDTKPPRTDGRGQAGVLIAALLVGASVLTGGVLATPSPARAASSPPWRFTAVSETFSLTAGSSTGRVLTCPAGFRPVWGGIAASATYPSLHGIRRYLEYTDPGTGTFHIGLRNSNGAGGPSASIRIVTHCVWAASLGTIVKVSQDFSRNAPTGHAGGTVTCPSGYRAITGGADWANTASTRSIDFSAPLLDGSNNATSWYATGQSPTVGDSLTVEAYCIEEAYLSQQYVVSAVSSAATFGGQDVSTLVTCPTHYRILTAGSAPAGTTLPFQDRGWAWASGPDDPRNWPAAATLVQGDQLLVVAVCIPASVPSVEISPQPASLTTSNAATLGYIGSDPTGESTIALCHLDAQTPFSCASGNTYPYTNLADGNHVFYATVTNESAASTTAMYDWTVDTSAPTVGGITPSPLSLRVTFSEDVTGVTASSLTVHAQSANKDVTGTITRPTGSTADWTPAAPLVPGETYRVSLTTAVHDLAGNALVGTFVDVRASTIVENSSPSLKRLWDRDTATGASGGSVIAERLPGSRADYAFTATSGQTVSVYGIRMPDGGYADVYLDGVKKATPHFYATSTSRVRVYLSSALTAGKHTISIRPLGTRPSAASAAWVRIDNVQVGATVIEETSLTQVFRTITDANAYGGKYEQILGMNGTDTTPAQFRVTGVGTGVQIYATESSTSGSARIYVDGVLKATVNLHTASTMYKSLVYSTAFALGVHTIRVEAVGTATSANSAVNFDRIAFT